MSNYCFRKANTPSSIQLWSKCSYTTLFHKKLVFCALLRAHLRAENGMHFQNNLILRIVLQETTPATGALRVYAVGSTQPLNLSCWILVGEQRCQSENKVLQASFMLYFFLPFAIQQLTFSRKIIISLSSHQSINGTCQGLCLVTAGPLIPGVCLSLVFFPEQNESVTALLWCSTTLPKG